MIALSALLHDCDDHKLFHAENNANVRRFWSRRAFQKREFHRAFYDKLLLISKELNTPSARKVAEKRDQLMQDFLNL